MSKHLILLILSLTLSCKKQEVEKQKLDSNFKITEKSQFKIDTIQLKNIDQRTFFRLEGASSEESGIAISKILTNQGNNLFSEIKNTNIPVLLPDGFILKSIFDKELLDFYSNDNFYVASHNMVKNGIIYNIEISGSLNGFVIENDTILHNQLENKPNLSYNHEGIDCSITRYGVPYNISITRDSLINSSADTITVFTDSILVYEMINSLKILDTFK